MRIDFDPAKDAANKAKHGVSLARAVDLEILAFLEDDRAEYGEVRYRAWGLIDGKGTAWPLPTARAAFGRSAFAGPMRRR